MLSFPSEFPRQETKRPSVTVLSIGVEAQSWWIGSAICWVYDVYIIDR